MVDKKRDGFYIYPNRKFQYRKVIESKALNAHQIFVEKFEEETATICLITGWPSPSRATKNPPQECSVLKNRCGAIGWLCVTQNQENRQSAARTGREAL